MYHNPESDSYKIYVAHVRWQDLIQLEKEYGAELDKERQKEINQPVLFFDPTSLELIKKEKGLFEFRETPKSLLSILVSFFDNSWTGSLPIKEFNQEFKIINHFYTTEYYITSAFNPNEQLISIYYTIAPLDEIKFNISNVPFDFNLIDEAQSFRWIKIPEISSNDFTFPLDKLVGEKLKVF